MPTATPSAKDVDPSIVEILPAVPGAQSALDKRIHQGPIQQSSHPSATPVNIPGGPHSMSAPIISMPPNPGSRGPSTFSNHVVQSPSTNQRRPNQVQRKQQGFQMNQMPASQPLPQTARSQGNFHRNGPFDANQSARSYNYGAPPPSLIHGAQRPSQGHAQAHHPNLVHGWQAPNSTQHPQQSQRHLTRPQPQSRQLFDSRSANTGSNFGPLAQQSRCSTPSYQYQVKFLDTYARDVVSKVAVGADELASKQRLRLRLENICREAVSKFEQKTNPAFSAASVGLKCFGSIFTMFATRESDIDLVLISPNSVPRTSSPASELPRLVEKALLDAGYGARLLTSTRVPIIKFCEEPLPDLAQLLLQERMRWETERDKALEKKSSSKAKKGGKTSNNNIERKFEPTLPQHRPTRCEDYDQFIAAISSLGSSPADEPVNERPQLSSSAIKISEQFSDPDQRCSKLPSSSSNLSDAHNDLGTQHLRNLIPQYGTPSNVASAKSTDAQPGNTEKDDPSLLLKSDEERVRLYRLAMDENWYEPAERTIINDFIRAVTDDAGDHGVFDEARAKLQELPNILKKYRPPPDKHLDFPKSGVGIQCDINFSNQLALHNSLLLRCYSLCDPRVQQMVLFVKAWAKKRNINTPYHGTLSSYGYVLMVLHYLINVTQPPVLPNLQKDPRAWQDPLSKTEVELEGHNIRFLRNEAIIKQFASSQRNQASLGTLLHDFFEYYGKAQFQNFNWMQDVISIRNIGGIISKKSKGWIEAKTETVQLKGPGPQTKEVRQRYLFAIEDPFETQHNVARTVVHKGVVAIRDEFRRGCKIIEGAGIATASGGVPEDLFAEAEANENLQYRYFGPRPGGRVQGGRGGGGSGDRSVQARQEKVK